MSPQSAQHAAWSVRRRPPGLTFRTGLIGAMLDADAVHVTAIGKTNVIAATAVARGDRGDIRTVSPEQTDRVRARMQAIVATHALFFKPGGYLPMAPTAGNRALLDRFNAVNRDLGLAEMPALDPLRRGAGDISFVARDVDGLAGLGTFGTGDHAPGETVDLQSIGRQAKRAALLMARLAAEPRAVSEVVR